MNLLALQDRLKNLSQEQLIREMQMPSGQTPQYLLLSELQRRKKMAAAFEQEKNRDRTTTVAQDVVTPGGMPQAAASGIAQAMAPNTDMGGNTGAAPQQMQMPSEEPKRMAGGGIVALQEGGQVVVRGGRRYVVQPDGTLLSEDAARRVMTPGQEIARDVGRLREVLTPTTTAEDVRTWGQRNVGDPLRGFFQPVGEELRAIGQPIGEELRAISQPAGEAGRSVFTMDRSGPPVPERPYVPPVQYTGEDQLFMPGSPLAPRSADAPAIMAAPSVAGPNSGVRDVPPPVPPGSEASGWEQFFFPNRGKPGANELDYDPRLYSLDPDVSGARQSEMGGRTTGTPLQLGDDLLPPPPPAPAPTTPSASPPADGAGGAGGGGGGGAPGVAQGPIGKSEFEAELLGMLEAREKRAEQDKWLALAQAGMALMSSKSPTFGGALGEAGQQGLAALTASREGAAADRLDLMKTLESWRQGQMELALKQQALAARARAGAGAGGDVIGSSLELSAGNERLINKYDDTLEALTQIATGMVDATPAQMLAAQERIPAIQAERDNLIRAIAGVPFAPAESSAGPEYVN